MKTLLLAGLVFVFLSIGFVIASQPDLSPTLANVNPSGGKAAVVIPSHAIEVAPGVFSLGTTTDVDGRSVEGFLFIDIKTAQAKPGTVCGNGVCESGESKKCPADCAGGNTTSTCFAFLAQGARWKTTEPYVLDTTNGDGMSNTFIEDTITTGYEEWDTQVGFDIFGTRNASATVDGADSISPDGKNEILFGDSPGIAATTVWGIFRGPPAGRELVEYDIVFNDVDYLFGDALLNLSFMDLGNVWTHEIGHGGGMAHPSDSCIEETMYRFADFGETKKRTLNSGDVSGITQLYS